MADFRLQSAVAIVTDVVKLACETRFLAPFYLNVVDLRKLSWKVCVVVFFNACVVTWILCVHEFMAWATFVFCPREYSDVGLLWEMCSTEPLDFFGP